MNTRCKITASVFLFVISFILCADVLFIPNPNTFFSHVIHCVVEGIIVLMFSRELRGESYR